MNGNFVFSMKCLIVGLLSISQSAMADVCDYRPSQWIVGGATTTTTIAGGSGTVAVTGVGMKALGLYSLPHATTGATMLGSTAAGTSAAGTTGIIAGTGGVLGSIGAALMSPFVIVPAAVAAVGVGVYEGACYFFSESQLGSK